jgi:hypothetical protein
MNAELKCAMASAPQTREAAGQLADMIECANNTADIINDKLYGSLGKDTGEKACLPNNLQNMIDRSLKGMSQLLCRLDEINSRL